MIAIEFVRVVMEKDCVGSSGGGGGGVDVGKHIGSQKLN